MPEVVFPVSSPVMKPNVFRTGRKDALTAEVMLRLPVVRRMPFGSVARGETRVGGETLSRGVISAVEEQIAKEEKSGKVHEPVEHVGER